MGMTEILDELPRLSDGDRQTILNRLLQLDAGLEIEETPEMIAAIDAGVRSMESGSGVPLEEARRRIAGWITSGTGL
jgi:predicted transcriptional regulator